MTEISPTLQKITQIIKSAAEQKVVYPKDITPTVPATTVYPKPVVETVPITKVPTTRTSAMLEFLRKTPEEKLAYFKARHFLARIRQAPEQISVYEFKTLYPDAQIPSSKYGKYDVVTAKNVFAPTYPGRIKKVYTFRYSPAAQHKIKVAGSIENYDKYLGIVRANPHQMILSHMMAGPFNLDLAFASTTSGITGASEREEILIKQLHRWKGSPESKGDISRMAIAIYENPFVRIAAAEAMGMGIGKVLGPVEGYVAARWGPRAVQALHLAQMGVGGAVVGPPAYSIAKKYYEGKYKEAIPETVMLSLLIGAGIEGYKLGKGTPKIWGKHKGLTPVEAGFKKGLVKSKRFDPLQKEYYNLISDIKQDLRTRHVRPVQEEPTYMNVEALKQYNQQKADVLRTVIKNQLKFLKHKAQVYGGAATEKVSTHDIDMMFKSARDPVVLEYIARKLGIDPQMVFDPHQLPGAYKIVTRAGAYKEPGYVYPSGQRGIRFTEQFYRLSESAMELAHKGRIKDISEAVRMLDLIYGKTGIPPKMQPKVTRFLELSAVLEQDPRIMDPAMSKLLYDSGIGKKLWDIRIKFYRKVLPETYLQKQFSALSNKDLNVLQNFLQARATGGLPPSMSIPFSAASYGMALWSAYYGDLGKKPVSKPSYPVDKSTYLALKSKTRKPSEYPEYPYSPYGHPSIYTTPPPGYPSTYIPPPSPGPYYSPPPSYPSAYYSPSYSPPYSPPTPTPPPPPGFLWFPRGGKVTAQAGKLPHAVQYYDEYAELQRLMEEVIL